jgi:hypothetical protein
MKPAEHVRANLTNDGLVLLDITKGRIFTANAIAALIWQNVIIENKPETEVVDSIMKEWESTREVAARDLTEFVDMLKQEQLVIAQESTASAGAHA